MTREAPPKPRAVRRQLEQVLGSPDFDAPRRSREFLRFIVEETVAGRGEAISQTTIATMVFGRRDNFDAIVDPIVRIQAGRLRRSLERYYLLAGSKDPVRIELPKGTYVPVFRATAAGVVEVAASEAASPERSPGRAESARGQPVGRLAGARLHRVRGREPDPGNTGACASRRAKSSPSSSAVTGRFGCCGLAMERPDPR